MRQQDKVIGVFFGDSHIKLHPPRARRNEPDWLAYIAKMLKQVEALASRYNVPIIHTGDVFDHWRVEPELLTFCMRYMPEMYAIPGQHDMPLHNIDMIHRSAFWTMVAAGKIIPMITPGKLVDVSTDLVVFPFPFGTEITPRKPVDAIRGRKCVAVSHKYFWIEGHSYKDAPESNEAGAFGDVLKTYDAAFFGDNHKGFLTKIGDTSVMNCGSSIRKNIDEVDYRPRVGLLCRSGRIMEHFLDTREDVFTEQEADVLSGRVKSSIDLEDFVNGLTDLQAKQFDFIAAINWAMDERMVNQNVRTAVLEAIERGQEL